MHVVSIFMRTIQLLFKSERAGDVSQNRSVCRLLFEIGFDYNAFSDVVIFADKTDYQ